MQVFYYRAAKGHHQTANQSVKPKNNGYFLWHTLEAGQSPQLQPQEERPFLLSLHNLKITSATTANSTKPTNSVPQFSAKNCRISSSSFLKALSFCRALFPCRINRKRPRFIFRIFPLPPVNPRHTAFLWLSQRGWAGGEGRRIPRAAKPGMLTMFSGPIQNL